jgi:4-hydroxythreonine-4-phosphate dehydrogenase
MIYVTQGHEKGIGLEIFLKSFLLLPSDQKNKIALVCDAEDLNKNLSDLKLNKSSFLDLKIIANEKTSGFSSTDSLLTALKLLNEKDILVTLPTSKDQLKLNGQNMAGYTEFFRTFFNNKNIAMTFKGLTQNVLLITDHLPLKTVPGAITETLIENKMKITLDNFKKYFFEFDEVIFAGINPHAGESGILGDEEKHIYSAIAKLEKTYGKIFKGPLSGDTLHYVEDKTKNQLLVYMFHDQGLPQFKSQYGLIGLNITLGLPFLRLSVDHGTAFDLYGKNKANISGMLYLLKNCFEVARVNK